MMKLVLRLGAVLLAAFLSLGLFAALPDGLTASPQDGRPVTPACVDCHGGDFGGRVLIDDLVVGRIVAPNLTRGKGGAAAVYSDEDWIRAIRDGVARDGRRLVVMPASAFAHYGNGDIVMMTTRLTTLQPVDRQLPQRRLGPLGRGLLAASPTGLLAQVIEERMRRGTPAPQPNAPEYGSYLAAVGCAPCHGESLRGATTDSTGPAPDLGQGGPLSGWTEEQFENALRTGIRPDGSAIRPEMPFHVLTDLDERSVRALWKTLMALPDKVVGGTGR